MWTPKPLTLHSYNGTPMKSQTMKAKMEELGVLPLLIIANKINYQPLVFIPFEKNQLVVR